MIFGKSVLYTNLTLNFSISEINHEVIIINTLLVFMKELIILSAFS